MKIDVTSFDGQTAGSIELSDEVFGLDPRQDLIFRMIRWQLAKRRAGTHAVKNRAEIARTGKKMYNKRAPAALVTARRGSRNFAAAGVRSVPRFAATSTTSQRRSRSWR